MSPLYKISTNMQGVALCMILAIGIVELATDIYISSLPTLVELWHSTDEALSFTISAYLLGLCLSGPFYGPLSDMLGRRPIFLGGIGVFTLASVGCIGVDSALALTALRFVQGMGAGVAWVLGLVIIRDFYTRGDSIKALSQMGLVIALGPAIAPTVGGYLEAWIHWRASFIVVAAIALGVFIYVFKALPETLSYENRSPFRLQDIVKNYRALLHKKAFLIYSFLSGLPFGGLWAYIYTAPFYIIEELGIASTYYGYYQMVLVAFYMLGMYGNKRVASYVQVQTLLRIGVLFAFIGSLALLASACFIPHNPVFIVFSMGIYSLGFGLIYANASVSAIDVAPHAKGASSALLGTIENGCAALGVCTAGLVYTNSILPVALLILGITSIAMALLLVKPIDNAVNDSQSVSPHG